jgi:uncharacterized protein YndB with AHSA1/START domain
MSGKILSDIEDVRHGVTVRVDAERAYHFFLEQFPSWWPHNFRTTKPGSRLGVDPREGGRFYEFDEHGGEHTFATLLACQSPRRLEVAWHLNGYGRIDPDPGHATIFEVRFIPEGATRTRVEVEHTKFERQGSQHARRVRNGMDKGWPTILSEFAAKVEMA